MKEKDKTKGTPTYTNKERNEKNRTKERKTKIKKGRKERKERKKAQTAKRKKKGSNFKPNASKPSCIPSTSNQMP